MAGPCNAREHGHGPHAGRPLVWAHPRRRLGPGRRDPTGGRVTLALHDGPVSVAVGLLAAAARLGPCDVPLRDLTVSDIRTFSPTFRHGRHSRRSPTSRASRQRLTEGSRSPTGRERGRQKRSSTARGASASRSAGACSAPSHAPTSVQRDQRLARRNPTPRTPASDGTACHWKVLRHRSLRRPSWRAPRPS